MNYIKIENLIQSNGSMDYKGLDVKKIEAGSQVYSPDFVTFYGKTKELVQESKDLSIVTVEEYEVMKEHYASLAPDTPAVTYTDLELEIKDLKAQQQRTDELLMGLLLGGVM